MSHPIFRIPVEDNFYSEIGTDGTLVMSEKKVVIAMDLIRLLGILEVNVARERMGYWEEAMKYEVDDAW